MLVFIEIDPHSVRNTANLFADRVSSHPHHPFIFLTNVVGSAFHEEMIAHLDGFALGAEGEDRRVVIRDLYEALVESL